jgi:hypothetical protein
LDANKKMAIDVTHKELTISLKIKGKLFHMSLQNYNRDSLEISRYCGILLWLNQ